MFDLRIALVALCLRQLLIFVNKKEGADTLANHLNEDLHNRAGRPSATPGFATTAPKVFLSIHGNKSQHERTDVIRKVRTLCRELCLLAATDLKRDVRAGVAGAVQEGDREGAGGDRCSSTRS